MILRKAKLDDFEAYRELYQDESDGEGYQWIYFSNRDKDEVVDEESEKKAINYFGEELLEMLEEEYHNYSLERFEKDLETDVILIAEKDSKVVGYIRMFPYGNGIYKIAEWAMYAPDDEETKISMLRLLLKAKLPRVRKFSICTPNKKAQAFLVANGFVSKGASSFLSYEVN